MSSPADLARSLREEVVALREIVNHVIDSRMSHEFALESFETALREIRTVQVHLEHAAGELEGAESGTWPKAKADAGKKTGAPK